MLTPWIDNPGHRAWLSTESGRLLDDLIADVTELLGTRFFEPAHNLFIEGWDRGWTASADYRVQSPRSRWPPAYHRVGGRSVR